MNKSFTRNELYELVWSQPLRTLAKRFGISDVALGKRCRIANIPRPGPGYWARKEAGKPVPLTKLPERGFGQSELIRFGSVSHYIYGESDEALLNSELVPRAQFSDGFDEVLSRAYRYVGKVRASPTLESPHPLIARLLAADDLLREKLKGKSYSSLYDRPRFDSPFERRRLGFLNNLFRQLERVGARVSLHGREATDVRVMIGDQRFSIALAPVKQPADNYPPTPLPASEKMQLTLGWDEAPPEVQTIWKDEPGKLLERQLGELVPRLFAYAEWAYRIGLVHQYEYFVGRKSEIQERIRREAEEAARKEHERLQKIAEARRNKLIRDTAAWRTAADIRAYVLARLQQRENELTPEHLARLETWANWAMEEANRIDPLSSAEPPFD